MDFYQNRIQGCTYGVHKLCMAYGVNKYDFALCTVAMAMKDRNVFRIHVARSGDLSILFRGLSRTRRTAGALSSDVQLDNVATANRGLSV